MNQIFIKSLPLERVMRKRGIENTPLVWKRFAAFLIDFLIVFMVVYTAFADILNPVVVQPQFDERNPLFLYFFSVFSLLFLLYFVMLEKKIGQSIGKIMMNLFVSGKNVEKTLPHLIRGAFLIPVFPFQVLLILDPLFMLFTKSNQRLTEIFSRTQIVAGGIAWPRR